MPNERKMRYLRRSGDKIMAKKSVKERLAAPAESNLPMTRREIAKASARKKAKASAKLTTAKKAAKKKGTKAKKSKKR